MAVMKTLAIVSLALLAGILPVRAGEPIDGIYGVVITNFECRGSLDDFIKVFHTAWQNAANGIEVPELVAYDPPCVTASTSLSARVAGLDYHCDKPMQAKDILDQAISLIGLHYVIVHPKAIQVYQDWSCGGQVDTRVFPVTVKGAKLLGLTDTVGNVQMTQVLLAAYGITPRWFKGVTQALYDPSKGGMVISDSDGGTFTEVGHLIWLADHGLIVSNAVKKSTMTNSVQPEKTYSITVHLGSLQMLGPVYGDMVGKKVHVPKDGTASINLDYNELPLEEAKAAISNAIGKVGYAFHDDEDGSISIIQCNPAPSGK